MWNGHNIRPSSNIQVPSGRPNIMYFAPHLWGTEDKLCMVPDDDIRACYSEVELRKTIPCDSDVYDLCTRIMVRDNLNLSTDSFHVVNLYLHLRQEISQLL